MKYVYRFFHAMAKQRVETKNLDNDWDWKLLYAYWRLWGKFHKRLPFLPNIHFRW